MQVLFYLLMSGDIIVCLKSKQIKKNDVLNFNQKNKDFIKPFHMTKFFLEFNRF